VLSRFARRADRRLFARWRRPALITNCDQIPSPPLSRSPIILALPTASIERLSACRSSGYGAVGLADVHLAPGEHFSHEDSAPARPEHRRMRGERRTRSGRLLRRTRRPGGTGARRSRARQSSFERESEPRTGWRHPQAAGQLLGRTGLVVRQAMAPPSRSPFFYRQRAVVDLAVTAGARMLGSWLTSW